MTQRKIITASQLEIAILDYVESYYKSESTSNWYGSNYEWVYPLWGKET